MAMTTEEWNDASVGDVLQLDSTGMTYVVVDTGMISEGFLIVSRTMTAQNPPEWTRMRKTVDTEELIQRKAEMAAARIRQSRS